MDPSLTFETAYKRLEDILDVLNKSQVSLEESLKIYEEADKLIGFCSQKLTQAEQKVQILIKNRSQELSLDDQQMPIMQEFDVSKEQHLNRSFS